MKPVIAEKDFMALHHLAAGQEECTHLNDMLNAARTVPEEALPPKTVRLNSVVHIWHSFLKKVVRLRIVLPRKAERRYRNISVAAPLSLAVFGRRENEEVEITIGNLTRHIKIIKVTNH